MREVYGTCITVTVRFETFEGWDLSLLEILYYKTWSMNHASNFTCVCRRPTRLIIKTKTLPVNLVNILYPQVV